MKAIAQSLQSHPPYLLVFGVIVLNYFYCTAIILRGGTQFSLYLAGAMVLMAFVAFATVRSVEGQAYRGKKIDQLEDSLKEKDREIERLHQDLAKVDTRDVNIENDLAKACITQLIANVRSALKYKNDVFVNEVGFRLKKFKEESQEWEGGDLVTDSANYERILQLFYKDAQKSVFATCNEEFLKFWHAPQSIPVMKAHETAYRTNGAMVTRVFMFSSFSDIKKDHLETIKAHGAPKHIVGKIFIFDESPGALRGSLFKDFVIIDQGEPTQATGVTSSFEIGSMSAKWMVDSDADTEHAVEFIKDHWCDPEEIEQRLQTAR